MGDFKGMSRKGDGRGRDGRLGERVTRAGHTAMALGVGTRGR